MGFNIRVTPYANLGVTMEVRFLRGRLKGSRSSCLTTSVCHTGGTGGTGGAGRKDKTMGKSEKLHALGHQSGSVE